MKGEAQLRRRNGSGRGWRREHFHHAVFIEVERRHFAIVFANREAIEPQLVVARMGEPATSFLLGVLGDRSGDGGGPGVIPPRDLLGYFHPRAGNEFVA